MSSTSSTSSITSDAIIRVEGIYNRFGSLSIHENLNMSVKKGEMVALVGGSGAGKTTLLRAIIMLNRPAKGDIFLCDQPVWKSVSIQNELRKRFGMLFQSGALFSSLTVIENILVPMKTHYKLSNKEMIDLAKLKISLSGLPSHAGNKYPNQLSGGMLKRASLARALALDPDLLFLDEPTAGLDPTSAADFDALMNQLKESLGLTIVMVTHDLDSLWATTDNIAFLGEKKLLAYEPMEKIMHNQHPLIQSYFKGPRGRAAGGSYGN